MRQSKVVARRWWKEQEEVKENELPWRDTWYNFNFADRFYLFQLCSTFAFHIFSVLASLFLFHPSTIVLLCSAKVFGMFGMVHVSEQADVELCFCSLFQMDNVQVEPRPKSCWWNIKGVKRLSSRNTSGTRPAPGRKQYCVCSSSLLITSCQRPPKLHRLDSSAVCAYNSLRGWANRRPVPFS